MNNHLSFPFRIGLNGRSQCVRSIDEHVKQELIQLVLTNLGERINIPEFGGGVRRLIFENASENTAAMTKANLTRSINRWLGHRLTLEKLEVTFQDSTIEIFVQYTLIETNDSTVLIFKKNKIN